MSKPNIIVICGPTASGKTTLSIDLALKLNAEVVSADSMQIYKEMNIGTAKPTLDERRGIIHHMMDIVSVTEEYNVSRYVSDAENCIKSIKDQHKNVIIVGGTGLYIDSLVNNVDFFEIDNDYNYRALLKEQSEKSGGEYLLDLLMQVDQITAKTLHKNDIKRLIRALEVYHVTGKPISQVKIDSIRERKYDVTFIALNYLERDKLYSRINERVDIMIRDGIIDEARELLRYNMSKTAISAIGYSDIFAYINGSLSLDEAVYNIKLKTRRYAKRQLTWFRRNDEINWLYPDAFNDYSSLMDSALKIINSNTEE